MFGDRIPGCAGAVLLGLAACQTVPVTPVQDFVAASGTLVQAESDYFDEIQAASDASHGLLAGAIYVGHGAAFADIAPELAKRDDFSKAKAARVAALTQVKNYAQQLAAIATAGSGTWIADDVKSTTADVSKLLADSRPVKLTAAQAGLLQNAVTALGSAILAAQTAGEIRTLAQAARAPIGQIAEMIRQDDQNLVQDHFVSGLTSDQTTAMISMLHAVYEDKSVNAAERLAALQTFRAWKPAIVTSGSAIQDALGKLQKANDALADGRDVSAGALARQAADAAQLALGLTNAGKK